MSHWNIESVSNFVQGGCSRNLAATIDRLLEEEERFVRSGFDKAAGYVNGVFCDLASIDVRFGFDPVSLDDCRCEAASRNEYRILCNVKHLPYGCLILDGNITSGAFQVRLNDEYEDSYDKVCWEDICTISRSGRRVFDTKKTILSLYRAITTVLNCERPDDGATVECHPKPTHLQLTVTLQPDIIYKFNLFLSIKVSRKCRTLKHFDEKIESVFEVLNESDTVESIQIVAKPSPSFVIWGLTFNDLENRLMNLHKFPCLRHCFFALSLLQNNHLKYNGLPTLSAYNLQLMTLKELLKHPRTDDWCMSKLSERLEGLLKSVKVYLRRKSVKNIFTEVNTMSDYRKHDLKHLSKEFAYIRKFYTQLLY